MYADLLSDGQRTWLLGLLLLWAAFLFGGFLFGPSDAVRRMPRWTRMASSAMLVVAAWSWFLLSQDTLASFYALFIAIGMSFGFLGDLWLAGLLPGGRNIMGGIAAFGVGHLFYIVAFLRFSHQSGLTDGATRWLVLGLWLLAGFAGWYLAVFRGSRATRIHWAALPYALLLSTTAGLATGMALQEPGFIPLAIGAALFLLSDLILAGELFNDLDFRYLGDVVWLTYGPAQMLIVYSIGTALQVSSVL